MQPGDVLTSYAGASEPARDYGRTPKITYKEGQRKFAEWYKEYYQTVENADGRITESIYDEENKTRFRNPP